MYHFAPELIIRAWRIEKEQVWCREHGWLGHGRGHGGNQHNSPFLNGPSFTTFAASFSHPCCASALRGRTDADGAAEAGSALGAAGEREPPDGRWQVVLQCSSPASFLILLPSPFSLSAANLGSIPITGRVGLRFPH